MAQHDFVIEQGATFNPTLKYSQPHLIVKAITGITKSAQAVVTCAHNLSVDWPVYVSGVVGMTQINSSAEDLKRPSQAYQGYYVGASTMRLDVDSSAFRTYVSGGELVYHPPVDLTGYTARMHIRATLESTTALVTLTTENAGITLGGAAGTIIPLILATATDDLTFDTAVYDLELISGTTVTRLLSGNVTLSKEVTR